MSKRETLNIESMETILENNDEHIRNIRNLNEAHYTELQHRKKAIIVTYGCQMNEHDSEKLNAMLVDMGYEITKKFDDSDLIIFNTCAVRENAEFKVYGNLGHVKKLKEKKPDLTLAVCGCMMQQPHIVAEIKKKYKYVDLVFGTHNLINFPSLLEATLTGKGQVVEVWDTEGDVIEGMRSNRKKEVKAYVNIMFGCDNFCTYCIVPYTRGRERSRKLEDIVEEIRSLALNGTKEVMLLGQNVNSYGKTLENPADFADLLLAVNAIEGLERIRFMTSHPKDISQKLIETMATADKVCEYLHLPVQAGSNSVLKRMNRRYTREQYLDILERARGLMPELGVTTDIIMGFPGETDEDFAETVDIVKRVGYDSAFTYLYSIRTGTPAAKFEDQVPEDVKHARITELLSILNPMVEEKMHSYEGKSVEILVEDFSKSSKAVLMGRTRNNLTVTFEGDAELIGKLVMVKITKPKKFSLFGEFESVVR
ncbi:MAG: tRNA (N6-isopentenyl adenosine(37)-C2)-methylthiotransferase MiaB [Clostridiales bacterium 38-18]|nr:MAG: tRNA (N6-isopentenyl adenosine(37)-C2)-methylthiotransferase MiaB [Clostridiales bacterium 38-18]